MTDPLRHLMARARSLMPGFDDKTITDLIGRSSEVRRQLTYDDPLAFALIYAQKHLRSDETGDEITLSDFHLDLVANARTWMKPTTEPAQDRRCYVAPRSSGKSTWAFLILPLWAAAHGHLKFVAAFSDSASQAELHLQTFKRELDENALLRRDFPKLCKPATRSTGVQVSDNRSLLLTDTGFAFAAKGIDAGTLGLKVGSKRPDLLVLDDVEPGESQYSEYQAKQRLITLQDVVLPLNIYARVMITGTVTMPGSIIHQLVMHGRGEPLPNSSWIEEEGIKVSYWAAILQNEDGSERSIWPAKWPLEYLESIRTTRSYAKNMANLPVPADGAYWTEHDFRYGSVPGITRTVLSIDPAVTSKTKSDATGMAVVGFSPTMQQCLVEWAEEVRVAPGEPMRAKALRLISQFPHITGIHVEVDQGHDLWRNVFHDMPPHIKISYQSSQTVAKGSKGVRAELALNRYQQARIFHAAKLFRLEEQMLFFDGRDGRADDLVDAVSTAINGFLPAAQGTAGIRLSVA